MSINYDPEQTSKYEIVSKLLEKKEQGERNRVFLEYSLVHFSLWKQVITPSPPHTHYSLHLRAQCWVHYTLFKQGTLLIDMFGCRAIWGAWTCGGQDISSFYFQEM